MRRDTLRLLAAACLLYALAVDSRGQEVVVTPDHADGIYLPGGVIRWTVEVKGAEGTEVKYALKQGGLIERTRGTVALTEGKGQVETAAKEPGWLLLEASLGTTNGRTVRALGGALIVPERIAPAQARPTDFDEFWQRQIKALEAIPANPQLTGVDVGKSNLDYFKLTMDNIRGSRIQGQLARPKEGVKFPAMLIVQWAGVYPLQRDWVLGRAGEGWLVLDINAHDLPIDEPDQFYRDQAAGPLKDYPSLGNDDRETSYFLRMYLSCYRAAQYLTERPDWDGRTLVVTGGSQGGLQSIVTAAIHPRITAVMASVPAGCDLNGPLAQRLPGWPMWFHQIAGKDETKVREAARYYDVVNFASRVRCPVLVGIGLIDTVCPPPGIYAACNQMKGPKEIVVLPQGEHGDKNGSHRPYHARFGAWNQALVKGNPPPIQ